MGSVPQNYQHRQQEIEKFPSDTSQQKHCRQQAFRGKRSEGTTTKADCQHDEEQCRHLRSCAKKQGNPQESAKQKETPKHQSPSNQRRSAMGTSSHDQAQSDPRQQVVAHP